MSPSNLLGERRIQLRNALGGLHAILHRTDRTLTIRAGGKETTVFLDTLTVELRASAASQPSIVKVNLIELLDGES